MSDRAELELLRQQQGPLAGPTVDPRSELEMLRQQQGPLATPAPTGGITFANNAESQGYGPQGDRSLPGQVAHVAGASVLRPLAPLGAATALGAGAGLLGGPFAELSVPAGAGLGAASYTAAHLADLPVGAVNSILPQNYQMSYPGQGFDNLVQTGLNKLGIGVPENAPERVAASTVGAVGDAVAGNELGGVLKLAANPTLRLAGEEMTVKGQPTDTTTFGGVGKGMSPQTTKQLAQVGTLGGISGIAAGEAREVFPDNPLAQMIAGFAAPAVAVGTPNLVLRGINAAGPNRLGAFITGNDVNGVPIPRKEASGPFGQLLAEYSARRQAASEAAAQDRLANEFQTAAGTPEQRDIAVNNLNDAINNLTDRNPNAGPLNPNFQPTSGTASGNTGLIRIEKGFTNQELADRNAQNQLAISQGLAKATTPSDVPVSVAQNTVNDNLNQRVGAAQNSVNVAEQQANDAAKTLAERQAQIQQLNDVNTANAASANVNQTLQEQRASADAIRKNLYRNVPLNVVIDVNPAKQAATEIVDSFKNRAGQVPPIIQRVMELPSLMTAQEADANLKDLYSAASQLSANLDHEGARAVGQTRDALDNAVGAQESVSVPLKTARDYNRTVYAPLFQQGASEAVISGKGAGGAPAVSPEGTIGKYTAPGANQLREIQRLKGAVSTEFPEGGSAAVPKTEVPATTAQNIRDWAVTQMASSLGQNPTGTSIRSWLSKNQNLMNEFPEVRSEIQKMANRLNSAAESNDVMAGELRARQAELSKTQSEVASSPQAKFVGDITNPANEESAVAHLNSFLYGDKAASGMATLLKEVQGNPQAVESLKNAVQKSLQDRITNLGRNLNPTNAANAVTTADLPTSTAKLNDLLREGSPTRNALSKIYSPEEMQALDRYRKQLELTDRINQKSTKGSDTQALTTAQEGESAVKRLSWGMTLTNFLKKVGSITDLANTAGRAILMKNPEQVYQQMKVKALLDPELARSLLLEPTDKNLPLIKTAFNKFLTAYVGADSQQNTNAQPASRAKRMIGE
jgi:chaperonin cofactor prefoldin